jgi:cardiolipin synthase
MLTLANLLTIARMITIPLMITLILSNHTGWALAAFLLAGTTDLLDGVIARRYKQSSDLGAILDPMADKLLMTACFIVLSLPDHPKTFPDFALVNRIPVYLTIVTISRDVFIVMIALVIHLTSGHIRFTPTALGKATTAIQVGMIGTVLLFNYWGQEAPIAVRGIAWLTLAATLASGFHYIYQYSTRMAGTEGTAARTPRAPAGRPE